LVDQGGLQDKRISEKFDSQIKRRLEKAGLETNFDAENEGGPFYKLAD
jgi:hypothetical protein